MLLADEDQEGGAKTDPGIATQIKVCLPTVNRVRQRFVERGLEPSLRRKEQEKHAGRLLEGVGEAHLIALICGTPPGGHKRWGLHLLRDTLIEQRIMDTISHEAMRQTLKK